MSAGSDHHSGPVPRRASRRRVVAGAAAALGGALLPRAFGATAASTDASGLIVPSWDDVPGCTPSPTDRAGQGPFFIHDGEREDDVSLFRQDIRGQYDPDAEAGTELQLHLRMLRAATAGCSAMPLAGLEVYVWHCDAQGFYSGFGEPGEQTPDQVYRFRPNHNDLKNNQRFCRGAGVSDAAGVVSFRSVFPGWYNGRDIHVHVMVLEHGSQPRGRGRYRGGDHVFTTQLYFEPALIDQVHRAAEPYRRRTAHPAYAGLILGDEPGSSGLRMAGQLRQGIVTAQMQLVLERA